MSKELNIQFKSGGQWQLDVEDVTLYLNPPKGDKNHDPDFAPGKLLGYDIKLGKPSLIYIEIDEVIGVFVTEKE